jgi:hypothetical protein
MAPTKLSRLLLNMSSFRSEALDGKTLIKRTNMLDSTSSLILNISGALTESRVARDIPSPVIRSLKSSINVLNGIHLGVEERSLSFSEAKSIVSDSFTRFLDEAQIYTQNIENEQSFEVHSDTVELSDLKDKLASARKSKENSAKDKIDSHHLNTKDLFQKYRAKYLNKIPSKLKNPGSIQVIELPLIAQFSQSAFMRPQVLKKLAIKATPVSFDGSDHSSDIGVVFEDQHVLMFSKSSAIALAKEEFEEHKANSNTKQNSSIRKNIEKQIQQNFSEIAKLLNKKSKADQDKLIESINEKNINYKVLIKNIYKDPKEQVRVQEEITSLRNSIVGLHKRQAGIIDTKKADAYKLNVFRKKIMNSPSILLTTATETMDELSSRSSKEFTLITGTPMINPKNSDIVMFWFIPKNQYKRMLSLTGGNLKITRWGLPWRAAGLKSKSREIPTSTSLSVKMR